MADLSPVAPPAETIVAIKEIAVGEGIVETDDLSWLVSEFLDFHNIDPNSAVIAILKSGYQITIDDGPTDGDLVERITQAIVGESIYDGLGLDCSSGPVLRGRASA